jgi:hypothetical protein
MLDEKSINTSEFDKFVNKLSSNTEEQNIQLCNELAKQLDSAGHKRVILDRLSNEPYLERYYVLNCRPYCRMVFHKFLKSDIDGLHDHPWGFENYIISGGYWEYNLEGKFWRPPGFKGKFTANYFHRIELDPSLEKEVWTIVLMGPQEKDWGFLDEKNKWIQWESYLKNKKGKNNV